MVSSRTMTPRRFKQIGLVTSPPVSRIIQDVPLSKPTTARRPKEKLRRKKRVADNNASGLGVGVGVRWGDVVAYSLVAGSIVGVVGIVWGSFRQ